jgi:hypothetical protein
MLTDDGVEWFIPMPGRGGRRGVRVGEHLPVDHALVQAFPECFTSSAEPVDTWPIGTPDAETRKRQQAERTRLASAPVRRVTPACARCGATSDRTIVMTDMPTALALISELSGLDDGDPDSWAERWRIEARYAALAEAAQAQAAELRAAEGAWLLEHPSCPEGTPPLAEPHVPARPDFYYRTPAVRTAQR